jgi:hypothetical protein
MNVDFLQHVKRSLSGVNQGVLIGSITATIITNADTFAGLYAAVGSATGLDVEEDQVNKIKVLPALNQGAALGILTDAAILNLTTVAGLRQLFTAQDGTLSETYMADSLN